MRLWPWMRQLKPVQDNQDTIQGNQDYEQYNAYSQLLDRNGQWIGTADTKAGVILGFLVIIFPVLAVPVFPAIQKAIKAIPHHTTFSVYLPAAGFIILLALFLIAALITLLGVLMTLTPRLARQRATSSLIFFSDIASQEYKQWLQHILALDPHSLALQTLEQIYTTACIADRKHKHVRQAIRALIATIVLGLMLYVLSQLFY